MKNPQSGRTGKEDEMTDINRRDFLKSSAMVLGAAAATGGISSLVSEQGSIAEAAEPAPVYEIYALKYAGPFTSKLAMVYWNEGWNEDIERNYYIWVIKGKGENIIVDTGTAVTTAEKKKLKGYINPVEVLARIGVNGSNVSKVIVTHIHFDHVGGIEMFPKAFPNAAYYVQKKEFDFWTKHPVAKRRPFLAVSDEQANKTFAALKGTNKLKLITGDQKIMPGIELLLAPGHTVGLQAVAVNTAKGTSIVASDCAHIARSFKEDNPSCLITDMVAWMESYDKLRAKASSIDLIFPGHDVMMLQNYPKVAEDVTRLV
jgi:glyoxylase-like metal-dependent hydrolase (beta-lactamase superfamily II)